MMYDDDDDDDGDHHNDDHVDINFGEYKEESFSNLVILLLLMLL